MSDKRPIIVIKKKAGHGGHHGGAWKVAYADFVTAMMALFIVLWLTSSGEKVKKSIAGYFNDPSGTSKEVGTDKTGDADTLPLDKKDIGQLKERLQKQIAQQPDLKKLDHQIDIMITPEGLRIELIEDKDGTFFETGSAVLNKTGQELLRLLAKELGDVPNRVSLEGHTDAQPYSGGARYDNWELSTDRANSARRLMQTTGLHADQLAQVRGFADQSLRVPARPLDPSNRRISVIVHYLGFSMKAPDAKTPAAPGETPAAGSKTETAKAGEGAAAKETKPASAETKATAATGPGPTEATPGKAAPETAAKPSAAKGLLHAIPSVHDATAWVQHLVHRKPAAAAAPKAEAGADAPK